MPLRSPWLARALCALAVAAAVALVPGATFAMPAQSATKLPLEAWAATFCTSFAAYETEALATQQQMQLAYAGVQNATEGAAATAALGDAFTATSDSARVAATAASANGIPDLTNGKQLAHEIEQALVATSTAYAKAAKQSSSLPTAQKKLSAAVNTIAKQLAVALDPSSPHARRLKKLDRGNKVGKAISSDPTCAAAVAGSGMITPATPATTTP
jgi:hypothetical protein